MLLRALLAFLALPGIVAFAVPLLIAYALQELPSLGILGSVFVLFGLAGLVWCSWAFYASGKGTLAPWSPPRNLVTHGLYRYSRNPMYCAALFLLAGWAIIFRSTALAAYAGTVAVAFHLQVVLGEEPWLAETHGEQWRIYKSKVNRWVGQARRGLR